MRWPRAAATESGEQAIDVVLGFQLLPDVLPEVGFKDGTMIA